MKLFLISVFSILIYALGGAQTKPIVEKDFPTQATFQNEADNFYTHLIWSESSLDTISLYTELSGDNKMEVEYVEKGLNEITIYLNDPDLKYITIDDFGNSSLGKYISEDFTVEEVCDAIQSSFRNNKEYQEEINLKNKVKAGQRLQAYNFTCTTFKQSLSNSQTSTNRAKLVSKIKVEFTIGVNTIAAQENKDMYLQVLMPDGEIYQDDQEDIFVNAENEITEYSGKRKVAYENKSLDVAIFVDIEKGMLTAGAYKIHVYCDGFLIGTDSFTLR